MPILGIVDSSKLKITGAYDSIASIDPNGVTSASFTSLPTTSYAWLELRITLLTGYGMYMRFNSDAGSNYYIANLRSNGSSQASQAMNNSGLTMDYTNLTGSGALPQTYLIRIGDYRSTQQYKSVIQQIGGATLAASVSMSTGGGVFFSSSALTRIDMNWTDNATSGSKISLYGMKGTIS